MDHEKIGQVTDEVKEIFNIVLEASEIKVNKEGLRSHMLKRHHNDVIHHIEDLELILSNPDFVGLIHERKTQVLNMLKDLMIMFLLPSSYIKVEISFMFRPCIAYKISSYKVVSSLVD